MFCFWCISINPIEKGFTDNFTKLIPISAALESDFPAAFFLPNNRRSEVGDIAHVLSEKVVESFFGLYRCRHRCRRRGER